jgi:hypothetical protein
VNDSGVDIVEFLRILADVFEECGDCEKLRLKIAEKLNLKNRGGNWQAETCLTPFRGARRTPARIEKTATSKSARKTIPIPVENELENSHKAITPRTVAQQVVVKGGRIRQIKLPKVKNPEPEPKVPPSVKPVFDYWQAHGLRMPKGNTKAFTQCVKAVRAILTGTFFRNIDPQANRKYDYEEIRRSIANFALAATNAEFEPRNKRYLLGLDINGFFCTPYAHVIKSWFLMSLESRPVLLRANQRTVEPLEDTHEDLTFTITRKFYNGNVPGNLAQTVKNSFITSAEKMHNFYHSTYLQNVIMSPEPIGQIVDYMLECLAKVFGRGSIKPANCSSDWTFTQCLPEYLSEINAWDSGDLESD